MTLREVLRERWHMVPTGANPIRVPRMSRNDLGALSVAMGWTRGAEVGVWKGAFSATLLAGNPQLHLLCVDPWLAHQEWLDSKNALPPEQGQRVINEAYAEATKRLATSRATIVRRMSLEAAAEVPDASLDFVYIDANHVYSAVLADLEAWTPKVRRGGMIAGHDYRVWAQKPTIHVVRAVNDFTKSRGIKEWFVLGADRSPSFLWEVA